MLDRLTLVGAFPRQRVEVFRGDDAFAEVNESFYRRGWTDGLPVVPPTLERVEAFLSLAGRSRNEVMAELDPLRGLATVEKVAVNAVMAGCEPAHLELVLAAVEAIGEPEFNLRGVQTTDENVAPLLIVSGPRVGEWELNGRFGALGPGWRANASIGRALRLVMNNIGGGWPAAVSFAGLGHPGRYTLCVAEHASESPWLPFHSEYGFAPEDTVLTVMRAESVVNVTGGLHEIADVMGSEVSAFSMARGGRVAVALAPHTARRLAEAGWSRYDVASHLHERGRLPVPVWEGSWLRNEIVAASGEPAWLRAGQRPESPCLSTDFLPVVESPADISVFVAGGDVPIAQHAYFPTWGHPPCRIFRKLGDNSR